MWGASCRAPDEADADMKKRGKHSGASPVRITCSPDGNESAESATSALASSRALALGLLGLVRVQDGLLRRTIVDA